MCFRLFKGIGYLLMSKHNLRNYLQIGVDRARLEAYYILIRKHDSNLERF